MNKTKPSPADAGLSTLLKAAQTIIANHERDDGYGAALVEIDKFVADPEYGEDLEKIAKELVSQPREIAERMKKLLTE